MYKFTFIAACTLFFAQSANLQSQESKAALWNNHSCAVVLTYDDGLNVHLDKVIPSLDSVGFKGTFYIPGNSPTLDVRLNDWRKVASEGHELGNHTLFHPCAGSPSGRSWVNPDYDLDHYTITRIMDEIKLENVLLKAVDGNTKRTFAYSCGDMNAGTESFYELIKKEFVSARGVISRYETPDKVDLYNVGAFMVSGQTGDELISMVKKAMEDHTLLVFLFHGVGGEHSINVSLKAHNELLGFLKSHEKEIWVAPFIEVSDYIKKNYQPK